MFIYTLHLQEGYSPLIVASNCGQQAMVTLLLDEFNVDVNSADPV